MTTNQIRPGDSVWAPIRHYDDAEIRVRVVDIEDAWLWVKLPGRGDSGLERVEIRRCVKSGLPVMTTEEADRALREAADRRDHRRTNRP